MKKKISIGRIFRIGETREYYTTNFLSTMLLHTRGAGARTRQFLVDFAVTCVVQMSCLCQSSLDYSLCSRQGQKCLSGSLITPVQQEINSDRHFIDKRECVPLVEKRRACTNRSGIRKRLRITSKVSEQGDLCSLHNSTAYNLLASHYNVYAVNMQNRN